MKKNFLNTLAAALLTGAVAVSGLTACSSEDNILGEQPATEQPAAVKTYHVSIPASFDGAQTRAVSFDNDATPPTATGRFEITEIIYVYNETKGEMLEGKLYPTDISDDGKSCNLTGTLTGTVEDGDKLTLIYNMNYVGEPTYCFFDYDDQNGSETGVPDGGLATGVSATISGDKLTTVSTVSFAMQQAIFRLQFTDGTNPITVKSLSIKSAGSDIAAIYWPFREENGRYDVNKIVVTPTTPTSDYLYVAVCINESEDPSAITFTVIDNEDNVYTGTKAAPTQGFKNGKYYYSSAATTLTWQMKLEKPTIIWTSVWTDTSKEPNEYNQYLVLGPWNEALDSYDPSEITISGTSTGYYFFMNWGATIHLNRLTATYDNNFIYSSGNLNLDISGDNSITCENENQAIFVDGTLMLSGDGTLTVTANHASRYGLYAVTNYNNDNSFDPSVLAADGYTVTRSDMTDNDDGTYTWTYTVASQQ